MSVIISATITLDKSYSSQSAIPDCGFFPSLTSEPAVIRWSQSAIKEAIHAPILITVEGVLTSIDKESPVLQDSQLSLTVYNINKMIARLSAIGVDLTYNQITVYKNEYDTTDTLNSKTAIFSGTITGKSQNIDSNEIYLTVENNKFKRKSNILTGTGDIFTCGVTSTDPNAGRFATIKVGSDEEAEDYKSYLKPYYDMFQYQVVGCSLNGNLPYNYYVRIIGERWFTFSYGTLANGLIDKYMYVGSSSNNSKDEYSRIQSAEVVAYADLVSDHKDYLPDDEYYLKINCELFHTNILPVDLTVFVQFFEVYHSYFLSKLEITGTVDDVFIKENDRVHSMPLAKGNISNWNSGVNFGLIDNQIALAPRYIVDEKTIRTFTFKTIPKICFCTDKRLSAYQKDAVPKTIDSNTDPYQILYRFKSSPAIAQFIGLYENLLVESASNITCDLPEHTLETNSNSILQIERYTDKNNNSWATVEWQMNTQNTLVFVVLEIFLPTIEGSFTFKECSLGIRASMTCDYINNDVPVKLLQVNKDNSIVEILSEKMQNNFSFNDIPNFYFSTYESPYGQFDEHYKEWQESYVHTYPDNASDEEKLTPKKTGISSFKIDADNAEKFNNIRKIGLFIPIKNNASDTFNFKITEACVIFSHETDISEVYV